MRPQRRVPAVLPMPDEHGRYAQSREQRAEGVRANLRHAGIRAYNGRQVVWVMPRDTEWDAIFEYAIREETGYTFSSYEYLGRISPNPSTNSNLLHMFLARGGVKTGEQQLDHNEEIEVVQLSIEELKQLVRENKIVQSMHITCILYALERLGEIKY